MRLFNRQLDIDFMGKRKLAMILSITLIVISLASIIGRGLNFGVDFTGGYLIELGYQSEVDITPVRETLAANGYQDALVQHFGTARDVLIRIAPREELNQATISDEILKLLKDSSEEEISMRRVEFVGPQVGAELRDQGGLAMLIALGCILVYVGFRFQLKSAVGAILALVHDVIIVVGVFSLLQMDFDLSILAAILAVIGYSLNDTVVVLDRIRETFRTVRKRPPVEILNLSINFTLARTLVTSLTTLLAVMVLMIWGGEVNRDFTITLMIGVVIGTYSSTFVASPALYLGQQRIEGEEKQGSGK